MRNVLSFFIIAAGICFWLSCNAKNKENSNIQANISSAVQSGKIIPADVYAVGDDSLYITLVGHASLMLEYKGKIIHIDPYSQVADYSVLPKADLILLTHEYQDHFDMSAINMIKKEDTNYFFSYSCYDGLANMVDTLKNDLVLRNYNHISYNGVVISAFPAYNMVHKNPQGEFYHPKGRGNGYLLNFGSDALKVYVAGDTENIPEMKNRDLFSVDIAFLPKNIPYTMDDDMFVDAAKTLGAKVLYPYHFSEFDENKITRALEGTGIELKLRPMKNN